MIRKVLFAATSIVFLEIIVTCALPGAVGTITREEARAVVGGECAANVKSTPGCQSGVVYDFEKGDNEFCPVMNNIDLAGVGNVRSAWMTHSSCATACGTSCGGEGDTDVIFTYSPDCAQLVKLAPNSPLNNPILAAR